MGGFSLQRRTTQRSTGLCLAPPPSTTASSRENRNYSNKYNQMSSFCCPNLYWRYDDRIPTFQTWPKSHPVTPGAIARAGFIYTGQGENVIFPCCEIKLTGWECFDIPMGDHRQHPPPNCNFMLILFLSFYNHTGTN